jgi:hypothetical protein
MVCTITKSINIFKEIHGYWKEVPNYPVEDWRSEVINDDTRQGYHDWVIHQIQIAEEYAEEMQFIEESNMRLAEDGCELYDY